MIKNLKKVKERILKAKESKEKIVIYADSDMDGVGSAIILDEIFKYHGFENEIKIYFPDRESEGYGLNEIAIENLKDFGPALIFTLDCGIGNIKEIKEIKKYGFDVIIIDHHQILNGMPSAEIIVDPHQEGETYPFHEFANAGLMYKLAEIMIDDKDKLEDLIFISALATIADRVPVEEDNKEIIQSGMKVWDKTNRLGFNMLVEATGFTYEGIEELHFKITGPLNSSDRIGHINMTYILLTSNSKKECDKIIEHLLLKSARKAQAKINIVNDVMDRINSGEDFPPDFVFEGSTDWDSVAIGSAASEILNRVGRPVFLYKMSDTDSLGSARLPKGLNGVKALGSAKDYLITYGGHPVACGFKLLNKNQDRVRELLSKFYRTHE